MEMTKVMGKCSAGMASAWNGMKRAAGSTKQEGKIAEAERRIARMTAEIGNLAVLKLDAGAEFGEDIAERYNVILEARKAIEDSQAEKETAVVTCPHCGKRTTPGMRFCGNCGQELKNA